jgi:hypothetical protein
MISTLIHLACSRRQTMDSSVVVFAAFEHSSGTVLVEPIENGAPGMTLFRKPTLTGNIFRHDCRSADRARHRTRTDG